MNPLEVRSRDGTPIAVFELGPPAAQAKGLPQPEQLPLTDHPPLLLVHGATADHTAFRVLGPALARTFTVHSIDRRGREVKGDS